ncbi:MAG: shikimate kinase, partial [Thermincola sp.]|nr:shikimate kinase [Thermincola sp.]
MLNLVLIGFMGTGKSTVGKKLAKKLGLKFVDTDQEVERVCGMTVNQIFKKFKEVRFRSEEKAALRRLTVNTGQVISTGGGTVLDLENLEMLRDNGFIVCLTAEPEVIYQRLKRKKNRPLLKTEDPLATVKQLLQDREPFY